MTGEWTSVAERQHNCVQDRRRLLAKPRTGGPQGQPAQTPSGKGVTHAERNTRYSGKLRRPGGEEGGLPHGGAVSAHPPRASSGGAHRVGHMSPSARAPGGDPALLPSVQK